MSEILYHYVIREGRTGPTAHYVEDPQAAKDAALGRAVRVAAEEYGVPEAILLLRDGASMMGFESDTKFIEAIAAALEAQNGG